eukprot:g35433.t1
MLDPRWTNRRLEEHSRPGSIWKEGAVNIDFSFPPDVAWPAVIAIAQTASEPEALQWFFAGTKTYSCCSYPAQGEQEIVKNDLYHLVPDSPQMQKAGLMQEERINQETESKGYTDNEDLGDHNGRL